MHASFEQHDKVLTAYELAICFDSSNAAAYANKGSTLTCLKEYNERANV
jgi:hypothetical protein